ncbi:MAG: C39 family peptidase [Leptospiraceae bacterium]|nr:C39 family peptidase [Leptospiraceae bacterium]
MILHQIKYNTQRDNPNFSGRLPGSWQCFPTSAVMFLSHFDKSYETKEKELEFIDDVQAGFGNPGIAEQVKGWFGISGEWWLVELAAIQKRIPTLNVIFDTALSIDLLKTAIQTSPVIIGTRKIGGLKGGHIILVVGYDVNKDEFIVHDPYGNANKLYRDTNGAFVRLKSEYLKNHYNELAIYVGTRALGKDGGKPILKKK